MRITLLHTLVCASVLAASPARAKTPEPVHAEPHQSGKLSLEIVDDAAVIARLEQRAAELIREKKAVGVKKLREQLKKQTAAWPLSLPTPGDRSLSAPEIYRQRAQGVLVVGAIARCEECKKYEVSGCSGFALTEDGVLVTNYHVVDNDDAEFLVAFTAEGVVAPITRVLAADEVADVAILQAEGAKFTPLPLAETAPAPGTSVCAISHPDHNFFSLTTGIVSRFFMAEISEGNKTPQIAITADFGIGSSGGAVFDPQGNVVGMICSTTTVYYEDQNDDAKEPQMTFKHCVPAASIRKLIAPKE